MMTALFEAAAIGLCAGAVIHSLRSRSWRRTLALFALPFFLCWAVEVFNMWWSHGYYYPAGAYLLWLPGGFPLAIACGWALTCYVGYLAMRRFGSFKLGVLAGAGVDAVLEPLAYYIGLWVWTLAPWETVSYFGAPVGNALGWLGIVALTLYSIKRLEKRENKGKKRKGA